MLRLSRSLMFIAIALVLIALVPVGFAVNDDALLNEEMGNDTGSISTALDDVVLSSSNDYYFDASAEDDGDGSIDSPFKYLTAENIKANSNIHLANGIYNLDANKNIERVNIYGSDVERTVIQYDGVGFNVNTYLSIHNVTFQDMSLNNYGKILAENVVFSYGYGSHADQYGNNFGGAIYTSEDYSNALVTVKNCTFKENFAIYGGAIYMGNGILDVSDCLFLDNIAYGYGGAIACEGTANVTISKSRFYNSVSYDDAGGAVYIKSSNLNAQNLEIVNSSATFGSAITTLNTNVNLNHIDCINNTAEWSGGAIYHMYGNYSMYYSNFINNSATNGGAIFIDNSDALIMRTNIFTNNRATISAGAVYSILNTLKNPITPFNRFSNNNASYMNDVYEVNQLNLNIANGNYTMFKVNSTEVANLPSRYSLVDDGYVTVVKDQQTSGNCWAYTAIAVLESCILKATGETYDLSEENMKNIASLYSDYGWNIETNGGGYDYMPWGYLVSWLGPVMEMDDLTDDKSVLSPVLNSIAHIQNILFLKRDNYTDNDAIKQAILKYGAVGTGIAYYSNYYNPDTNSFYCYSNIPSNHAVTIVGWDDSYSKLNFKWGTTIAGDGAWIVRNSWGPNWGDKGYFYVSYYDMKLAQPGVDASAYTFILNDTRRYDRNYQYDIPGQTDFFYNESSTVSYKNVFLSESDEYLAAVSTYFEKPTNWTASIYVNDEFRFIQSGTSQPGYYTIDLNELISLAKGDVFEVIFRIAVDGQAGFPISEELSLNNLIYSPGTSFVSYDGNDWQDLYDLSWIYSTHKYSSQVACIKAFTIFNPINVVTSLNIICDGQNPVTVVANVVDEYGNLLNCGEVTLSINGVNHHIDVVNGQAIFKGNLNQITNFISATFNAIGYNSTTDYASVDIEVKEIHLTTNITRILNNVSIDIIADYAINASVIVFVNETEYPIDLINGKNTIGLNNLSNGKYSITGYVNESFYYSNYISDSFCVDIKNTTITAGDLTVYDTNQLTYNITLTDCEGNPLSNKTIIIVLNNQTHELTTDNGVVSLKSYLGLGKYDVEISFAGDNDYLKSEMTKRITVMATAKISISYERYQNDVLVNISMSKPINETLTVKINNKTINVNMTCGLSTLRLDDLQNGMYDVSAVLNDDFYMIDSQDLSFEINVIDTRIISKDLSLSEDSNSFNVSLVDGNSNPLSNRALTFNLNNETFEIKTDDNGIATIDRNLKMGHYDLVISFAGDDDYFATSTSNELVVKSNVSIDMEYEKFQNNVILNISISKPINETLTVSVNDDNLTVDCVNGTAHINLDNLTNGQYDIGVKINNVLYQFSNADVQFAVEVSKSHISAENITTDDSQNFTYSVKLTDDEANLIVNQPIRFVFDDFTYNATADEYGVASLPLSLKAGNYSLFVLFDGCDDYFGSSAMANIEIKPKVSINLAVERYQNNANVTVTLSRNMTENITLIINNDSQKIEVREGMAIIPLNNLENGDYDISVMLDSNSYAFDNSTLTLSINVTRSEIVSEDIVGYENVLNNFTAKLVDVNGNPLVHEKITFSLNNESVDALTDDLGYASFSFNLADGNYSIEVKYEGSDKYLISGSSNTIAVKKYENVSLVVDVKDIKIGEDLTVNIVFNDTVEGNVSIIVDGVETNVSISGGKARHVLSNLTAGEHNITVSYPGDSTHRGVNMTTSVKVNRFISKFTDMTIYGNGTVSALLVDETGKPIADAYLKYGVNGTTDNTATDENGQFSIFVGSNGIVWISYDGNDKLLPANCTFTLRNIAPARIATVIDGNNFTQYAIEYYSGERGGNFTVQLKDVNGNVLSNKIVLIGYNGKTLLRTTDENGYANVQINLKDENRLTFAVTFLGDGEYSASMSVYLITINKKPVTITALSKTYKASAKTKKYTVTLNTIRGASCDGKTYFAAGKKVTLTLNGKTYTGKTNSEGQVTFKLSITKKGSYSAKISFAGDSTYYKATKTVKNIVIV